MCPPRIGRLSLPPSKRNSSIDSLQSPFEVSVPANVREGQSQQPACGRRPSCGLRNLRWCKAGCANVHGVVRSSNCLAGRVEVISQTDKSVAERSALEVFGE